MFCRCLSSSVKFQFLPTKIRAVLLVLFVLCVISLSQADGPLRCEVLCRAEHLKDKCDKCMSRIPMRFGKRGHVIPSELSDWPSRKDVWEAAENEDSEDQYALVRPTRKSWKVGLKPPRTLSPHPDWVCYQRSSKYKMAAELNDDENANESPLDANDWF